MDRRSGADYQMAGRMQRSPGLGTLELRRALVTLIFLFLLVGAVMAILTPEGERFVARAFGG